MNTARAKEIGELLIEQFKSGNLPQVVAPLFLANDEVPCRSWSFSNQCITAIHGTIDARAYRQWSKVGRSVLKGKKAFYILAPNMIVDKAATAKSGKKQYFLAGFRATPVFRIEDTEVVDSEKWEDANKANKELENWIQSLPFIEVAKAWNLNVTSYTGKIGQPQGWYSKVGTIALGVENLSTWAHELIHASDDKLGNLTERGQHWRSEFVAEFGGAILLNLIAKTDEADIGGCWEYVQHYAKSAKTKSGKDLNPVSALTRLLDRTCKAVNFIIDTAKDPNLNQDQKTPEELVEAA